MSESNFRKKLEELINCNSIENGSNTPDFILADYLIGCLEAFDWAINRREKWHKRGVFEKNKIRETSIDKDDEEDYDPNCPF